MAKPIRPLKNIQYLIEYLLVKWVGLAIQPLSALQVYRLGRWLGSVSYRLASGRKKVALTNLDIAFGNSKSPQEKKRIVRRSFEQMVVSALQCLWVLPAPSTRVVQLLEDAPTGLDILERCLSRNKGVFLCTAHYANWEVTGLQHGLLNAPPMYLITRRLDNPYLENLARQFRTATGNGIFHKDDSPQKIVRALKNNSIVTVMMDQNTAVGGVFVDFFGKKAATARSVALLSHRMGTAIMVLSYLPTDKGTYRITYGPELPLEKSGDKKADILNWTQACVRALESIIRENPEYWMWGHRRWKTRPPDEQEKPTYL